MKFGISVSIYVFDGRSYESTTRCVQSLSDNSGPLVDRIVLVDDASPSSNAMAEFYGTLHDPRIEIVRNKENLGIARVKNQGIKILKDYDVIVLADNDVQYRRGWDSFLFHAMYSSGAPIISLSNLWGDNKPVKQEKFEAIRLNYHLRLNGAFIAFTQEVLQKIGGFPNLPEKYGQEHVNFQLRAAKAYGFFPHVVDIEGLKDYLVFQNCPSHLSDNIKKRLSNRNAVVSNEILASDVLYNGDFLL